MAYDDKSPSMNIDSHPDPHGVLQNIAQIDSEIMTLRKVKEQLLNTYHTMMTSYEKHYHEVMDGPSEVAVTEEEMMTTRGRY